MENSSKEVLSKVLHLPSSGPSEKGPLSADVYAVRGREFWWIFDVGACDDSVKFINGLEGKKNVVVSHFHRDHSFNLDRIEFENLYVGRETFLHCSKALQARRGMNIVETPVIFEDGIKFRIEVIPSSHAKGSLMLTVYGSCVLEDTFAFLGDSTYPMVGRNGPDCYNVQLLSEQIKFLRCCNASRFFMSHRRLVPREKESILQVLESYYAQREPHKNFIDVAR